MKYKFFNIIFLLLAFSCSKQDEDARFTPSSIVGGELVDANQFTGVVSLVRDGDFHCSGVLIAKNIVLTAAHCVTDETHLSIRIYVGAGLKKPANKEFVKGQYSVSKIKIHPGIKTEYGGRIVNLGDYNANDIAILFLKDEIQDIEIYPVLTDLLELKNNLIRSRITTVVGYGYVKEEEFGLNHEVEYGLKRKVDLEILDHNNHEVDIRSEGKDSCYIDSGGPAFIDVNGSSKLLALVSGSNGGCAENEYPVYYSLVYDSVCWIANETGLNFDDVQRNCERNNLIQEKCSESSSKQDQSECAKNLSDLIFKTQILD